MVIREEHLKTRTQPTQQVYISMIMSAYTICLWYDLYTAPQCRYHYHCINICTSEVVGRGLYVNLLYYRRTITVCCRTAADKPFSVHISGDGCPVCGRVTKTSATTGSYNKNSDERVVCVIYINQLAPTCEARTRDVSCHHCSIVIVYLFIVAPYVESLTPLTVNCYV